MAHNALKEYYVFGFDNFNFMTHVLQKGLVKEYDSLCGITHGMELSSFPIETLQKTSE